MRDSAMEMFGESLAAASLREFRSLTGQITGKISSRRAKRQTVQDELNDRDRVSGVHWHVKYSRDLQIAQSIAPCIH